MKITKHLSLINILILILSFFPLVIACYYTFITSIDIPYYDEWNLVPLIEKWLNHQGQWSDLFLYVTPGASYVVPFCKSAVLINALYFSWNIRFEIFLGIGYLIAASAFFPLYFYQLSRDLQNSFSWFSLLPIMMLLFSLRQTENLIAPWGLGPFGVLCFGIGTGYLLSFSKNTFSFAMAVFSAICATFSFTSGLLVWPIGLGLLLIQQERKQVFSWVTLGGAFLSYFFVFLYVPTTAPSMPVNFSTVILRLFCLLGGSLSMASGIVTAGASGASNSSDESLAIFLGVSLILVFIFLIWKIKNELKFFLFPLFVSVFALASCLMIAYGRASLGIGQAFSSRYSTWPLLFVASIVLMIATLKSRGTQVKTLESSLITVIMLSCLYSTFAELDMSPHRHANLQGWADKVYQYKNGSDLSNPHFSPEQMREYISAIEKMNLSIFKKKH